MNEYSGTPIEMNEAWKIFDRWRNQRQEVGIIFWGRSANVYTLGFIESATNGRVQIQGNGARASFNLVGASFKYGPMQTWPRWPSPPIVEVTALRAEFENGDYLALAEGLTPPPISSPSLPSA
jgi:hypothetical protein